MSVELRPLGVNCNIACQYCYQNPQRDAGNLNKKYDIEQMKKAVLEEGGPFTMFGGEPLLVPKNDLEELWKWGLENFGSNGIQTNGVMIDEDHIALFRKYSVQVGISIDGPGELNDVRWAGTLEKTRESTAKVQAIIKSLCDEGMPPSLIITLHRNNATAEKLPVMHEWMRYLDGIGIRSARLHILESDSKYIQDKYALTMEENIAAMLSFGALENELKLKLDLFNDIEKLLTGNDQHVSCVWRACDSYTTPAVRGVEGRGQRSNCGRTNKDGIDFVKADTNSFERYLALYHTPQEYGGCKDCRFFVLCKGQCPGTAINGDWRKPYRTLFSMDETVWACRKQAYTTRQAALVSQRQARVAGAGLSYLLGVWSKPIYLLYAFKNVYTKNCQQLNHARKLFRATARFYLA